MTWRAWKAPWVSCVTILLRKNIINGAFRRMSRGMPDALQVGGGSAHRAAQEFRNVLNHGDAARGIAADRDERAGVGAHVEVGVWLRRVERRGAEERRVAQHAERRRGLDARDHHVDLEVADAAIEHLA